MSRWAQRKPAGTLWSGFSIFGNEIALLATRQKRGSGFGLWVCDTEVHRVYTLTTRTILTRSIERSVKLLSKKGLQQAESGFGEE